LQAEKIIFKVNVQAITGLERQWQQNTKPDLWLNSIQKTFMRGNFLNNKNFLIVSRCFNANSVAG